MPQERQTYILDKIIQEGRVHTNELAETLGVTSETIRRDLRVLLARDERIDITYGGALLKREMARDYSLSTRLKQQPEAKKRIGNYAMSMIRDKDVVYFSGIGACVWAVANLRDVHDLVVVTSSLEIASIIAGKLEAGEITGKLIILGGGVIPEQKMTQGFSSLDMAKRFRFTKIFVGASALTDDGPMLYDTEICEFNRALIKCTKRTYLLAESAKFLKNSVCSYAGFDEIDCFITDDANPIPIGAAEKLREYQVRVYRIGEDGLPIDEA